MRIAYVFGCACLGIGALLAGAAHAEGTVIVPLANVTPACIDASKKTVDLWVLSARVPSDANWLRQTKGVGARVDVTLRSKEGQRVSFPAAAAIDTRDLGGKVVRASLQLHVLADQDLWNTSAAQPIRTADVSVPLTFIRRQGKSDAVKVFQALLAFTKSASAVIPANPYVKGAELVGQLSDSIGNAFAADPNDIFDPNFSLAFSIARSASNCSAQDLHDDVGVAIADFGGGKEKDGYVATADVGRYCFYKAGHNKDPDIVFAARGNGACPGTAPATATVLANPQFIWMAYGHCKEGVRCEGDRPPPPLALAVGRDALPSGDKALTLLSQRLDPKDSKALLKALNAKASEPLPDRPRELLDALAICRSVGIDESRCLDKSFSSNDG